MMPPPIDHAIKRKEQRLVLLIGTIVAGLPILFQLLMAGAMLLDPGAFPHRDRTLSDARFWPIQIVLLCIAVAGNAAVDWIRVMRRPSPQARPPLIYFLCLVLAFILVSMMFAVCLLDNEIGLSWLGAMSIFGLITLIFACMVEMEIAILVD